MSKLIDLTGKRFNNLTVIERSVNAPGGIAMWLCLCDCGNKKIVRGSNLKSGAVKSCGCAVHHPSYNRTHNMSKTKLYRKWWSMKRRCFDPSYPNYCSYGGRGIKVCDDWKNSFEKFYEWASRTRTDDSLTLERIDVNGDYCPENCTWVSREAQANNRRSNVLITYNGKTQNLTQWCNELGVDYKRVHNRMFKSHWSFEKAVFTPVK